MATAKAKDDRITARVPHAIKERFEAAASAQGSTLNQFLVDAAMKEATVILERERRIRLSAENSRAFFEMLDNPPAPNERLKAAVAAYRERYEDREADPRP